MKTPVVGIIGGGFSGTMVAAHLLRQAKIPLIVKIFESRSELGKGAAYGTHSPFHLLNVPAARMSAIDSSPNDFVEWLKAAGLPHEPLTFAPRKAYGTYVDDLLEQSAATNQRTTLQHHQELVQEISFANDHYLLKTSRGSNYQCDIIVLALGNFPPGDPLHFASAQLPKNNYIVNPWSPTALEGVHTLKSIALIGSGLTAIDLVVEATNREFTGKFFLISRHGFWPQGHQFPLSSWETSATLLKSKSLREMLQAFREELTACTEKKSDWRAVIDALRPHTQNLWMQLSINDQQRFLRHLRVLWDIHRHRVAPEISDLLQSLKQKGALELIAGRVTAAQTKTDKLALTIEARGGKGHRELLVNRTINCTGPAGSLLRLKNPLLTSLFSAGLITTDKLEAGLATDTEGRVLNTSAQVQKGLFTLGPLRKGMLWETTAVREIRSQAEALSNTILKVIAH